MKKTLYQILGVDPKASAQDIEAAYAMRLEELKVATIRDPNKLVVLQQSRAILSDPIQRAAYDASISVREVRAPSAADEEPERTFIQRWGKWIAVGVVLIGVVVWWARHGAVPPPQKQPPQKQPPQQVASRPIELAPQPVQPASEPAAVPADPKNTALPAALEQPPADLSANPVLGEWSCTDAISGRTSKYNFQQDGVLRIASSDGQISDFKYELSEKDLKLTDPKQVSKLAIEELVSRKLILNAGAGGQRVVCKR
jgi:hypothetical protein